MPVGNACKMKRVSWLVLGGIFFLLLTCCLLFPQIISTSDRESGFGLAAHNIRQIGMALQVYHDHYGQLPPRVIRDQDGRPLYSWRVVLLPFLEGDLLYRKFKLDEPWDGPNNKALLAPAPRPYRHHFTGAGISDGQTHHQVFVGPGTAFERDSLSFADFTDGLAETLMVVEAAEPVPWSKPEDLEYATDKPLPVLGAFVSKPVKVVGWELARRRGTLAVFADGNYRFIPSTTDEQTLRALITRNGGESVDVTKLK
jgi:hypothetical protein